MMRCHRCNVFEVEENQLCSTCKIAVNFLNEPKERATDEQILESSMLMKMKEGCRECGSNDFGYNAGVLEEGKLKWFIIQVKCHSCGADYDEALDVRIKNEFNKNEKQAKTNNNSR